MCIAIWIQKVLNHLPLQENKTGCFTTSQLQNTVLIINIRRWHLLWKYKLIWIQRVGSCKVWRGLPTLVEVCSHKLLLFILQQYNFHILCHIFVTNLHIQYKWKAFNGFHALLLTCLTFSTVLYSVVLFCGENVTASSCVLLESTCCTFYIVSC